MALPNEPITRQEMYLSNIAGQNTALPDAPITREEMYLDYIAKTGGTGEGDMKKSVYDSDNSVASAGGIKMFVNQKIGTIPQKVGTLETKVSVLEGEVASIEDNLDNLGTASTKNSTSVVTESTDLVESGAVKDIVGWGNANLLDKSELTNRDGNTVTQITDGVIITLTKNDAYISTGCRIYGDFADKEIYLKFAYSSTGNVKPCISVRPYDANGNEIVNNRVDGVDIPSPVNIHRTMPTGTAYLLIVVYGTYNVTGSIGDTVTYTDIMVSTADIAYEPHHASVEDTLRDAEVIKGKNLIGWKIGYVYSSTDGSLSPNTHGVCSDKIRVTAGQKFIGSKKNTLGSNDSMYARTYDANGDFVGTITVLTTTQLRNEITIPANIGYIGVFQLRNSADVSREWLDSNEIMFYDASETDPTYEPYYVPLKDVVPTKADNSVIAPTENGSTTSQAYAVGSHAIRNGAFITWKNAKAQGEPINDASDYTSGDVADNLNLLLRVAPFSQYGGDCNNLPAGFAYANSNATNIPEQWSIIITFNSSNSSLTSGYMSQFCIPLGVDGSRFYMRNKNNGTWSDWYKFEGTIVS